MDGAGLNATWNESFTLEDIAKEIRDKGKLIIEAYDSDPIGSGIIGSAEAIDYKLLMKSTASYS